MKIHFDTAAGVGPRFQAQMKLGRGQPDGRRGGVLTVQIQRGDPDRSWE